MTRTHLSGIVSFENNAALYIQQRAVVLCRVASEERESAADVNWPISVLAEPQGV